MSYVIAATWKAKPGEEEAFLGLRRQMAVESRREPYTRNSRLSNRPPGTLILSAIWQKCWLRLSADTRNRKGGIAPALFPAP